MPSTNYKFMQLGEGVVWGVCKFFVENEIAVLRFWDGIRKHLALDAVSNHPASNIRQ